MILQRFFIQNVIFNIALMLFYYPFIKNYLDSTFDSYFVFFTTTFILISFIFLQLFKDTIRFWIPKTRWISHKTGIYFSIIITSMLTCLTGLLTGHLFFSAYFPIIALAVFSSVIMSLWSMGNLKIIK